MKSHKRMQKLKKLFPKFKSRRSTGTSKKVGKRSVFGKSYRPITEDMSKGPSTPVPSTPVTIQSAISDSEYGHCDKTYSSSDKTFTSSESSFIGSSRSSSQVEVSSTDFMPILSKFSRNKATNSTTTTEANDESFDLNISSSSPNSRPGKKAQPRILASKFDAVAGTSLKDQNDKALLPIEEELEANFEQSFVEENDAPLDTLRRFLLESKMEILSLFERNSNDSPAGGALSPTTNREGSPPSKLSSSFTFSNWWKETSTSVQAVNGKVSDAFSACILESQDEIFYACHDDAAAQEKFRSNHHPLDQSWLSIPDHHDDTISRLTHPAELKSIGSNLTEMQSVNPTYFDEMDDPALGERYTRFP